MQFSYPCSVPKTTNFSTDSEYSDKINTFMFFWIHFPLSWNICRSVLSFFFWGHGKCLLLVHGPDWTALLVYRYKCIICNTCSSDALEKQVLLLWLRNVLCNDVSSSCNYAKNVMWLHFEHVKITQQQLQKKAQTNKRKHKEKITTTFSKRSRKKDTLI